LNIFDVQNLRLVILYLPRVYRPEMGNSIATKV
jgi:hypothetical protein